LALGKVVPQVRESLLSKSYQSLAQFRQRVQCDSRVDRFVREVVLSVNENSRITIMILARLDLRTSKTKSGEILPQDLVDSLPHSRPYGGIKPVVDHSR